jgi:hypothetical protein
METKKCSIEGCEKSYHANGLCEKHYYRQRRHGDPTTRLRPEGRQTCSVEGCERHCYSGGLCKLHARRKAATGDPEVATVHRDPTRICTVEGCGAPYAAKGLCSIHYQRHLRNRDSWEPKIAPAGAPKQFLEDAFNWNSDECLIWPYLRKDGYARIAKLHYGSQNVCRIICERTHGPDPSGKHQASHTCHKGDDGCINPRHLIWETQTENGARKKLNEGDVGGRGSRHYRARLVDGDVRTIRSMLPTMTHKDIAKHFDAHIDTVGSIARGRSWAWLK